MPPPEVAQPSASASRVRWVFRLARVLAKRELRTRYRQSLLNVSWVFLLPVLTVVVYGYVLTRLGAPSGCAPYWITAWTGIVLWTFFAESVGMGANSLVSSANLITKVYFPREALPLAVVAAGLVDLTVGVGTVLVIMPFLDLGFTWAALGGLLSLALLILWAATLSTFTAVLATFLRDIPHAVRLLLQVGFFATPVVYEVSAIPALAWSAKIFPLSVAITQFRSALLCGEAIDLGLVALHLVIAVGALGAALGYARVIENRIADVV